MLQLSGYDSAKKCFEWSTFPYCYGKYTSARMWIETNKSYGQRQILQFADPESDTNSLVWFKPKPSPFGDIVIMVVQNDPALPQYGQVSSIPFHFAEMQEREVQLFSESWYFDAVQMNIVLDKLASFKSPYRTNFKGKPVPWGGFKLVEIGAYGYSFQAPVGIVHQNLISQGVDLKMGDTPIGPQTNRDINMPSYDIAPFDAARLVLETYVPMTYEEASKDRVAWAAHHKIKTDAEDLLKTEPGYSAPEFSPVTIADLTRGGK